MGMIINRVSMGVIVALGCTGAMAVNAAPFESRAYIGASASLLEYSLDGSPTFDSTAVSGKFGYRFTPAIAFEGRLGGGVKDDELDAGFVDVETRLRNYIGGYLVLGYDSPNPVYPYLMAGVTHAEAEFKFYDTVTGNRLLTENEAETAFSYGVGANFVVTRNTAVTLDYSWYLSKDRFDLEGASLGLVFQY